MLSTVAGNLVTSCTATAFVVVKRRSSPRPRCRRACASPATTWSRFGFGKTERSNTTRRSNSCESNDSHLTTGCYSSTKITTSGGGGAATLVDPPPPSSRVHLVLHHGPGATNIVVRGTRGAIHRKSAVTCRCAAGGGDTSGSGDIDVGEVVNDDGNVQGTQRVKMPLPDDHEKRSTTKDLDDEESSTSSSSTSSKDDDDDDDYDDMTDDEALSILEEVMKIHMSPSAARGISKGFADLGVDTPAKMRSLIVRKSLGLIGMEMIAVFINAVATLGMIALFKGPLVQDFLARGYNVPLQWAVELTLFAIAGVFTVEAAAHATILFSFVTSELFFGTTNLEEFVNATRHLSAHSSIPTPSDGAGRGRAGKVVPGGGSVVGGGGEAKGSSLFVVSSVKDAAASLRAVRKLAKIRSAVEREIASLPSTEKMDSMQRLAALFELTRAEREDQFVPSAYDLDTEQAMRVAALFAEYDQNCDGIIDLEELNALLRDAAASASAAAATSGSVSESNDDYFDFSSFDDEEANLAIEVLDADGSGSVNLEEFVAWYKGGCPLVVNNKEEEDKNENEK